MTEMATIKALRTDKGYGFVTLPNGRDAFLHANTLDKGVFDTLQIGDRLRITLDTDQLGRVRVATAERM